MSLNSAECPVCKTPISETQFSEIQTQIRAEEFEKLEKLRVELQLEADRKTNEAITAVSQEITAKAAKEAASAAVSLKKLSDELDEAKSQCLSFASERKQLDAEHARSLSLAVAEATKKGIADAQQQLAQLENSKRQLQDAVSAAHQRESEAAIRYSSELQESIDAAVSAAKEEAKLDLNAVRQRQAEAERRQEAIRLESEQALKDLKASHSLDLIRQETEIKAAVREAADRETLRLEEARKELSNQLSVAEQRIRDRESAHTEELQKQRAVLDEAKLEELSKMRAQVAQDNEALRKKLHEAERKLEQKTANELGQVPEGEIEKALRDAFPEDGVSHQLQERLLLELQEIDVDETAAHKKIWERRGAKHRKLQKLVLEANESIAAIVELEEFAEMPPSTEGRTSAAVQDLRPIRTGLQH